MFQQQAAQQQVKPDARPDATTLVQDVRARAERNASTSTSNSTSGGVRTTVTSQQHISANQIAEDATRSLDAEIAQLRHTAPLSVDQANALRDRYLSEIRQQALDVAGRQEQDQQRIEAEKQQQLNPSDKSSLAQPSAATEKKGFLAFNDPNPQQSSLNTLGSSLKNMANQSQDDHLALAA